jgi:transcriptional antiterminator RfaH
MEPESPAWYCVRARQKQEHIAAANLKQVPGIEVFNPRLRFRRATQRGPVWFTEPLFPSYLFARFALRAQLADVRHTSGVSTVVHFADRVPAVPDDVIAELKTLTGGQELIVQDDTFAAGQEVRVAEGAFQGLIGIVKQVMPAAQRVKILLEILGRETAVEVDARAVVAADPSEWKRAVANGN